MKIRKAIKIAVAGAALAVPASVVMAMGGGPHTPLTIHGDWNVGGTTINANCPVGYSCVAAANTNETGFLQRQVINTATGATYIQTIVAEGAALDAFSSASSGFFGDESFVALNGSGGLSGQSKIYETSNSSVSGVDVFDNNASLNTGEEFMPITANTDLTDGVVNGAAMIKLDQTISNTAQEFSGSFKFDHGMTMTTSMSMGKFALVTLDQTANDTANGFTGSFQKTSLSFDDNFTTATAGAEFTKQDVISDLTVGGAEGITQNFRASKRTGAATGTGAATILAGGKNGMVGATFGFAAGDSITETEFSQAIPNGGGLFGFNSFGVNNVLNPVRNHTGSDFNANGPFITVTDDSTAVDPFAPF